VWETRWSIPAIALQPGTNQITVTAEDIKGLETRRTVTIQNGHPRPQNGVRRRAKRVGQKLAAATPTLSGRRVRLGRGRTFRMGVRCPSSARGRCSGVLRLYLLRGSGSSAAGRWSEVGAVKFDVRPGRTIQYRIGLSRHEARLLRRSGRLKALAIARTRDTAGNLREKWVRFTALPPL
jgi:hypothetical protein